MRRSLLQLPYRKNGRSVRRAYWISTGAVLAFIFLTVAGSWIDSPD